MPFTMPPELDAGVSTAIEQAKTTLLDNIEQHLAATATELATLIYTPNPSPWMGLALKLHGIFGDAGVATNAGPLRAETAEEWDRACEAARTIWGADEVIVVRRDGRWAVPGGVA